MARVDGQVHEEGRREVMETIEDIVKWLRQGCGEFAAEIAIQKINNPHYDAEDCMDCAL